MAWEVGEIGGEWRFVYASVCHLFPPAFFPCPVELPSPAEALPGHDPWFGPTAFTVFGERWTLDDFLGAGAFGQPGPRSQRR